MANATYDITGIDSNGKGQYEMVDVEFDGSGFRTSLVDLNRPDFPRFMLVQQAPEGEELRFTIREMQFCAEGKALFALYRTESGQQATIVNDLSKIRG